MPVIRRTLKRREIPGHVRYLTCSCYQRLPLFENDWTKNAFAEHLSLVRDRLDVALYGWVIMPEHIHLLLTPALPRVTVTDVLRALKRPFARKVLGRWRRLDAPMLRQVCDARRKPHFWQRGGGYDRNIVTDHELYEKLAYLHANPVRRRLVARPTAWTWSSALWYERREGLNMDPLPV